MMNAGAMGFDRFFVALAGATWGPADAVGRVFEVNLPFAAEAESEDHCPSPKYLPRHRMLANHGTRRVPATPCGPLMAI